MFFITYRSNQEAADEPREEASTDRLDALVYGTEDERLARRLIKVLRFEFAHRAQCIFKLRRRFSPKIEEQDAAFKRVLILRAPLKRKPTVFQWIVARYCMDLETRLLKEREVEVTKQLRAVLADGRACTLLLEMRKHDCPRTQQQMVREDLDLRARTLQMSTVPLLLQNGLLERPQGTNRKGLQLTALARQCPNSFWDQAAKASNEWRKPKSAP